MFNKILIVALFLFYPIVGRTQEDSLVLEIDTIIETPDVEAQFPGGYAHMQKYISESLVYPTETCDDFMNSRVILSFIVDSKGTISTITLLRSSNCSSYNEVWIKLIQQMPNWIPAKLNGKDVPTIVYLPIHIDFN